MTIRMLVDGSHSEEIRVVVADDERVLDYDVETAGKEQTRGNLYIGEITRVEPSLQAAFIDYGSNKNGFLAFSEIHPGFFDLPEAEKQELVDELRIIAERRSRDKSDDRDDSPKPKHKRISRAHKKDDDDSEENDVEGNKAEAGDLDKKRSAATISREEMDEDARALAIANSMANEEGIPEEKVKPKSRPARASKKNVAAAAMVEAEKPADDKDDAKKFERKAPIHRRYNIQDVIKSGQKILVQVVKEERGTKGAALTTYFSLPGRYTVLMPNTPYAGGISRKITNGDDRKLLRDAVDELKLSNDSGLIVRTAGVGQDKESIKNDYKNLNALWTKIQKSAKEGTAPECVHEDGSLAIRALRDMYNEEIDEIIIAGTRACNAAKDFSKTLMPDLAKIISEHKSSTPIFTEYGIEKELHQLHKTRVNLPSGGYLIINPTEALVAIDVNSGRATQERNLEETAVKTNMEAANEVARQVRLRDLSGLIVVDFIDMEDRRNGRALERTIRKAVRRDRARIQIGGISEFGLIEISRQRLRPSVVESTLEKCSHCQGSGWTPSLASSALMVLRSLEDENAKTSADKIILTTSTELAVYILNHKRDLIKEMEATNKFQILIHADNKYISPDYKLEMVVVKADGSESIQSKEIALRENLEDEAEAAKQSKGRRGGGKKNYDDNKRDASSDRTSKPDNKREERPSRDRQRPTRASASKTSAPTETKPVETAPAKEVKKVQGRHPRRTKVLIQPDAVERDKNGKVKVVDSIAPMPKSLGRRPKATKLFVAPDEVSDEKKSAKKTKSAASKKKPALTLEIVDNNGKTKVDTVQADKPSVAKTFQRWWSNAE